MKPQRKLPLLLLLVAVLGLSIAAAGCGGENEEAAPAPPAEEPPSGEGISVGLVTDTGGVDDRGFNEFSINALERAAEDFGIETRIYVSIAAEDYLPNLTAAAEDGHDLVVAVGFLLTPDTTTVAEQFPDIKFVGVDHFFDPPLPNTYGMLYPTEESGYLAGVVAALMTQSGVVSTVGGKKIPPVDNWIAGFHQAVIDTNPDIKLLSAYSDDFVDQALCKEIALDHLSQGADVVFQVAGQCGLGAIDAACEKGVFAIGVDADQAAQGECVITSALKPLEQTEYDVIKSFVEGNFIGGENYTYGVENLPDAPRLAAYSADVPQEVQDAVAVAQEKLASGEIDPPATLEEVTS